MTKPTAPQAVDKIAQMAPYALANLQLPDGVEPIMLAQNECLRGPSPDVQALTSVLDLQLYPDPEWRELRSAIAEAYAVQAEHILCGAGSMELIAALCQVYLQPGDELLASEYAYAFMQTCAKFTGCTYVQVKEPNFTVDVDLLLAAVTPATKIVFVANPGNPMGTSIDNHQLRRLREDLPAEVILIIDQAYGEFTDQHQEPLFDLAYGTNTVIFRTLSKAYALAGLRVGWGLFPADIKVQVRKLMNPNNISLFSQAAATAAIQDQRYMQETVALTNSIRDIFQQRMQACGVEVISSHSNFIMVNLGSADQLAQVDEALHSQGVLTRPMGAYDLHQWLRITIGTQAQMQLTADIIQQQME